MTLIKVLKHTEYVGLRLNHEIAPCIMIYKVCGAICCQSNRETQGKPLLFFGICTWFFYMCYTTCGTNGFTSYLKDEAMVTVLLEDTSVTAGDSNPHCADQKHLGLNLVLLKARPRHFHMRIRCQFIEDSLCSLPYCQWGLVYGHVRLAERFLSLPFTSVGPGSIPGPGLACGLGFQSPSYCVGFPCRGFPGQNCS